MMKKIPYLTDTKLHDKVVEKVRQFFDTNIDWLEYSYPIVYVGVSDTEAGEVTYPQCYAQDGSTEHYRIFPDNITKAFCFFELNDSTEMQNDDGYFVYSLSVVFYARLDLVEPYKSYDFTAELIAEVIGLLKTPTINAFDISYERNPENVFDRYNELDQLFAQQLMKHGTGFKITFSMYDSECLEELT